VPASDPEDDDWDLVGEAIRFLLSPIMLPVTLGYGIYDYMEGTDHLDRGETLRNAGIWGAAAGGSWLYHRLMFPGQYSFLSGSAAARTVGYLAWTPLLIPVTIATAAAVGYVATSDVHGGVIPGVTSMGGVGPGYYQNTSDPMGEFEEGVRGFFSFFGF